MDALYALFLVGLSLFVLGALTNVVSVCLAFVLPKQWFSKAIAAGFLLHFWVTFWSDSLGLDTYLGPSREPPHVSTLDFRMVGPMGALLYFPLAVIVVLTSWMMRSQAGRKAMSASVLLFIAWIVMLSLEGLFAIRSPILHLTLALLPWTWILMAGTLFWLATRGETSEPGA